MPITVLIFDLPALPRDVVRETLASDTDIAVVVERSDGTSLATAIEHTGASVVIVGADHPEVADTVPAVLRERARLRVLALSADDGESVIHELQPRRRPLGELSSAELLKAVRQ